MINLGFDQLGGGRLTGPAGFGKPTLVVNTASECGYTPQYAELQQLWERYRERGLVVLGVPCNQFGEQEPGSSEEIATFCSATYGVTFPMAEKVEVNGDGRHPLYDELTKVADADGRDGDIQWNFEKFLVAPGGQVTRFGPMVAPEDDGLVSAVTSALPG